MANRVATVNFTMHVHNDTFTARRFNFFAADGTTELDLSDVTPRIQVRKDSYNGRLVLTSTVGDGITWVDQSLGQFTWGGFVLSWPSAGKYYYDIQFTYATSGVVRTYVRGCIELIDDATHSA